MTELLQKAFTEASKLPISEQDMLAAWILEKLASEKHEDQQVRAREHMLIRLRDGEKALLRELMNSPGRTIYRPLSDGIASGLSARGIIVRTSNAFHFDRTDPELTLPYTIQPWAEDYFYDHPDLLALSRTIDG